MKSNAAINNISVLWQLADWQALASFTEADLEHQNNKAEYALMIVNALLHQQQIQPAGRWLKWAKKQGATQEQITKYLLASLKQTLAEISLLQGETTKAKQQLIEAFESLQENVPSESVLEAQIKQFTLKQSTNKYVAKQIAHINLGQAWAGNSVNTVIFRSHAVFTHQNQQYTAFYVDGQTLRLVKRDLQTNEIQTHDLKGEYNLKDAHNSISLGMDRQGYLHISFDHHGTQLNYRRTLEPSQINAWTDSLPMTGNNEQKVTYPTFILPQAHTPLLILYRDGNWKQGQAYLKYYDEALKSWFDYPTPILSGAEQKPWTSNAYWNHPAMGEQGVLHLSFTWRTDYFSEEQLVSNINMDYAKSYDHGLSWVGSHNQPFKLPITPANSETVWPIAPGSNHINQTSMALDSKGYPHIVFYANDEQVIPQYQHLWFDGKTWQKTQVSQRTKPFKLAGGGTLEIPISRPEIVIDKEDTVFVIYRSQETQQKLVTTYLQAPAYKSIPENTLVLWEESVGQAEPIIDRIRWAQEQVLTLLVQYNEQPNGDLQHQNTQTDIQLIDIKFKKEIS